MKRTDSFRLPEPPPWQDTGAALDLLVAPNVPGRHPCGNCPAMCCWFVPVEQGTLESTEDLDAISEYLAYERLMVWVEGDGAYNVGVATPCRLLEPTTCACTVHNQPEQPRYCVEFEAASCWYRARFEAGRKEEALRLDGHTWPDYRARLSLSPRGRVSAFPDLSPYALVRAERRYAKPAVLALDIPAESATTPDRRGDMLVFLANFEGVRIVRAGSTWQMQVITQRDDAVAATALEEDASGGAGDAEPLILAPKALGHLNDRLGAGLWDASAAELAAALDGLGLF